MTSQPGLKARARNANLPAIVYAMYCPVYGCTSDSKKNTEKKLSFFSFPKPNSKDEQKRRDVSGLNFASEKALFQQNARVCVHYILAMMHIFHRILLTF